MVVSPSGTSVAGICHAGEDHADPPLIWQIYFAVEDGEAIAQLCEDLGRQVVVQPWFMGNMRYCVIRDPAGGSRALYRLPDPSET